MSKPQTLFAKLFRKQRGNCYLCGIGMSRVEGKDNTATFDHIIPLAKMREHGVEFIRNNKRLACAKCNRKKGSLWLADYEDRMTTNQTKGEQG